MAKKVKQSAPPPRRPSKTPARPSRSRYLLAGLVLLALAAGAYYFFGVRGKSKGPTLQEDSGSEPTLTAKNPRLQLLSAGETGIDFKNYILEDATHNIVLNLNQYNGGGLAVADINNDNLPDIYFISC